ncbi:unnamed protein product [Oikopleura dioica]|uniref:Uncharacterized protein n=2 Tax=Oikopleura dioica TaxID=34765 RepID=E4XKV8_OIKDI|nr:unnamed protein product [Oikopleura dioica]
MKLSTFLALGAVGVNPKRTEAELQRFERSNKQCIRKDWEYPERGGRLTRIVDNLTKVCKFYIDKPAYQCRCLKKQKNMFWTFIKARRVCRDRQNNQSKKNRTRRDAEENEENILDEDDGVVDQVARDLIDTELSQVEGPVNVDMLEELYFENCDGMDANSADRATTEECEDLTDLIKNMKEASTQRGALDEEIKERAEIIYRINRMHNAMSNWVRSYVSKGSWCKDKRSNYIKRIEANTRRMQDRRRRYPTNPQKLKRKRKEEREEREAAAAAENN